MGRIFVSVGHGGGEGWHSVPGLRFSGMEEVQELLKIRDLILLELRSRDFGVFAVPGDLTLSQKIDWINERAAVGDVAVDLQSEMFSENPVRGAGLFYIPQNDQRRSHAELLLFALLRRVPQLPSRGTRPDTTTTVGHLPFCRQVAVPSLLMHMGFLNHSSDRQLFQTRQRDVALGIADGLAAWSRAVAEITPTASPIHYPTLNINLNGGLCRAHGILVNGNAYIPIDIVDQLGIDWSHSSRVQRLQYRHVVYVKALELREHYLSVSWDGNSQTVFIRSALQIAPEMLPRIMRQGNTSDVQLMMFLKGHNEDALLRFPDLPKLYREEGAIEGVNYDLAFAQMCFETQFLQFWGEIHPDQYNFAGLGTLDPDDLGASFPSARVGVRAHIQHLKAYACREPLVQEVVDPRFQEVTRGSAPSIHGLSGRWSADPHYGKKVMAILRRLYESTNLL